MKVVLLNDEDTTDGPKRAGSIIEHPQAHMLIKLGKAVEYVEPPVVEEVPAEVPPAVEAPAEVAQEPPIEQTEVPAKAE